MLVVIVLLLIIFYILHQPSNIDNFYTKLPYNNLNTTHFKDMFYNKMTAKNDPFGRGYYQNYIDYYDDPSLLSNYNLGYSINGFPYNDMKFMKYKSMKYYDIRTPKHKFYYPSWLSKTPSKNSRYIGYPYYFQ